jgi:hypothetical protein
MVYSPPVLQLFSLRGVKDSATFFINEADGLMLRLAGVPAVLPSHPDYAAACIQLRSLIQGKELRPRILSKDSDGAWLCELCCEGVCINSFMRALVSPGS